jgi:hypothetical protein
MRSYGRWHGNGCRKVKNWRREANIPICMSKGNVKQKGDTEVQIQKSASKEQFESLSAHCNYPHVSLVG